MAEGNQKRGKKYSPKDFIGFSWGLSLQAQINLSV